jgi:hypothetical protein
MCYDLDEAIEKYSGTKNQGIYRDQNRFRAIRPVVIRTGPHEFANYF